MTDAIRPSGMTRGVAAGHIALSLILIAVFLVAHAFYRGLPSPVLEAGGWGEWADQSKYIEAARAWSHWDFTPGRHWYPPGYALLGAPFLSVTPYDRFLIPNLVCLIVCQMACASLATRMFQGWRLAGLIGAAAFLVSSVGNLAGLKSWLIPWSTTPAATFTLLALVTTLRLAERPGFARAMLAGAMAGAIPFFRPADIAPVAMAAIVSMLPALVRMPWRRALRVVAGAMLGAGVPCLAAMAIIAATSGFGEATYYGLSAKIGFEIGLIPLRWVTLVVSGNPIFDGVRTERVEPGLHLGMAQVFPWMITGVGGLAACLAGPRVRIVHVMLATFVSLHVAMMLAYRDLHIIGLWLYGNYHYFKVTQPIFFLFSTALLLRLMDRATRWRSGAVALAAIVAAFGWRAALVPIATLPVSGSSEGVVLPSLDHLQDAAILHGGGTWRETYFGVHRIWIGATQAKDVDDFRIYPRVDDLVIVPLRRLPAGRDLLVDVQGLQLVDGAPVVQARQDISFGLPCAFNLAGAALCGTVGAPLSP